MSFLTPKIGSSHWGDGGDNEKTEQQNKENEYQEVDLFKPLGFNAMFHSRGKFGEGDYYLSQMTNRQRRIDPTEKMFNKKDDDEVSERIQVKSISVGTNHVIVLDNDNKLYGSGCNGFGQLGLSDKDKKRLKFVRIKSMDKIGQKVVKVRCGKSNTLVLTSSKRVYGFGSNYSGELGVGDYNPRNFPTLIEQLNGVFDIKNGYSHSLFLTRFGVYACGNNEYGQLGVDNLEKVFFTSIKHGENDPYSICTPKKVIFPVSTGKIVMIEAGNFSSYFLSEKFCLYGCGGSLYGQLGMFKSSFLTGGTRLPIRIDINFPIKKMVSGGGNIVFQSSEDVIEMNGERFYECGESVTNIFTKDNWGEIDYENSKKYVKCHEIRFFRNKKIKKFIPSTYGGLFLSHKGDIFILGDFFNELDSLKATTVKMKNGKNYAYLKKFSFGRKKGDENEKIVNIYGSKFSRTYFFVTNKGKIYVVGNNNDGMCGLGKSFKEEKTCKFSLHINLRK